MRRRRFCASAGLATLSSLTNFPSCRVHADIGSADSKGDAASKPPVKRFLLLDLGKLDAWDNCELVQGSPTFEPHATFTDDSGGNMGAGKPSVYFDSDAGLWRMIYNIGWSPIRLMAAVSEDGIHWKPDPQPEIAASANAGERIADHQVYFLPDAAAGGIYHDPIASDGYPFKIYAHQRGETVYRRALQNEDHPWHSIAKQEGQKRYFHESLMLVSKDGLRWQLQRDYSWSRPDWHPEPPYFGYYNRRQNKHVMVVRPGWGDRRIGCQTTTDFRRWSDPELMLQMDPLDKAPIGFYAMPVLQVDQLYIGLPWIFHNSSSRPVDSFNQFYGTMDAEFAYSYDGVRFVRGLRTPFLQLNSYPAHGCTQLRPYSLVELNDEVRIYSGAARAPHGREAALRNSDESTKAITLHRLRKDGWMYLRSVGDWARFQTKPMGVWSAEIRLNAQAPFGAVRYQITNERSRVIEGFSFEECIPLEQDDVFDWPLRWKQADSSKLIGKVIRLELEFQNAHIYSLSAAYHMLDAQDQWLLKDGKPIDTSRFDY